MLSTNLSTSVGYLRRPTFTRMSLREKELNVTHKMHHNYERMVITSSDVNSGTLASPTLTEAGRLGP